MSVSVDHGVRASGKAVVRDYGDCALLIECDSTAEVLAWTAALTSAGLPGVLDIVPAYRTVLVKLDGPRYQAPTRQRLERLPVSVQEQPTEPPGGKADVVIDVVYDGADLVEVGRLSGLDPVGVIAAHTGSLWRVGFGGFAPGFSYLIGGDRRLQVPRRDEPRTKVPAGAVGLAGEFSGVYPRESPGGWQLIGHTDAVLWDVERPEPALLRPGMWVQFRAV
ncbi:5-oxoprolinase subunit B family protein [[Mycobacterium] burgundiense]|uniref:Allophanate hydrolase subunit 1 n=1 Tax=[Mycobacterium] burgundiense TaxID=3064286 RepID=A0ABN9NR84_9MYCO|nr:allophanate hydrolase subunit 1 [Mycolicibacterium sp. MU0053]CAJ1509785.1 allophanate hydrolase subunit 1 [Mycolicibacterium sp. MU0053]